MKTILTSLIVLSAIFLFWGFLLATPVYLAGDKEGAKNLVKFGVGMVKLTPFLMVISYILMELMI